MFVLGIEGAILVRDIHLFLNEVADAVEEADWVALIGGLELIGDILEPLDEAILVHVVLVEDKVDDGAKVLLLDWLTKWGIGDDLRDVASHWDEPGFDFIKSGAWFGVDVVEIVWEDLVEDELTDGGDEVFATAVEWETILLDVVWIRLWSEGLVDSFGSDGDTVMEGDESAFVSIDDFVDVREEGYTFLFADKVACVGGMPVGSSGKGIVLLSGGIDSPVAGFMMAKRGMKIEAVHFHSYPYTSEAALEKVKTLAALVSEYTNGIKLYTVKFTHIQEAIHEKCPEELMITLMRRFMMRIAERLAAENGVQAIITGESLGQVASQTIESITSSNSVVKMPVLRPLIAFDKLDIISIANKIKTYETSILPYEDCCTVFLPKHPVIKPKLDVVSAAESALDVEALINEAMASVEVTYY